MPPGRHVGGVEGPLGAAVEQDEVAVGPAGRWCVTSVGVHMGTTCSHAAVPHVRTLRCRPCVANKLGNLLRLLPSSQALPYVRLRSALHRHPHCMCSPRCLSPLTPLVCLPQTPGHVSRYILQGGVVGGDVHAHVLRPPQHQCLPRARAFEPGPPPEQAAPCTPSGSAQYCQPLPNGWMSLHVSGTCVSSPYLLAPARGRHQRGPPGSRG